MVTEKTARQREAAVLQAVKPEMEKLSRGLEYLEELIHQHNEAELKYQEKNTQAIQTEREIHIRDQRKQRQTEQENLRRWRDSENFQAQTKERVNEISTSMVMCCEQCGTFISPVQLICHKCGEISSIFPYEDRVDNMLSFNVKKELGLLEEKIKSMDMIMATDPAEQAKINTMQRISLIAQTYQRLARTDRRKAIFADIQEAAEGFINRCQNKHIEVAVVGDVKAGKSTLINALLGERMAITDTTPETSTLVKYRTTNDRHYVKVSFYSSEQWQKLWDSTQGKFRETFQLEKADEIMPLYLDRAPEYKEFLSLEELREAIRHWTSKVSREHYFVSELEVGYCGDLFPHDVILVDTPGLNDPVRYRSQITKEYIRNANWVLACIHGSENKMSEASTYEFLNMVRSNLQHNSDRMIIVATAADTLMKKKREQLQAHFFEQMQEVSGMRQGTISNHFIYTSPLVHLLFNEWLSGKLDEDDDSFCEELASALYRFDFRKDIHLLDTNEKELFRKRLGIETLKEMLEKNVFRSKRRQLSEQIAADFKQTYDYIRSNARRNLVVEASNMSMLQQDADEYYEHRNELQRNISEISQNRQQIQQLLESFER